MPNLSTVIRWLGDERHAGFRTQYAQARELQADTFVDQMIDIADDAANDFVERERPDGSTYEAFDQEHVKRSALRIDARKWIAARMQPKKYGDKVELGGAGEGGAVTVEIVRFGGGDA